MTALNVLYRDMTAAAAAIVITLMVSVSFVQSTATAPSWQVAQIAAAHTAEAAKLASVAG